MVEFIWENRFVILHSRQNFFDGWAKAAAIGAFSGAVTAGIGQVFGSVGGLANEIGRAGAHAISGGVTSEMQGGSFWQGALSGGISSGIGSGIVDLGGHAGDQIIGGGLAGGIGSSIAGGNFFQGMTQGLMVGGLNHGMHSLDYHLRPLKYSTKTAKRVFNEAYGDIPYYTDIVADGSKPTNYNGDGSGVTVPTFKFAIGGGFASRMYLFKSAFSSKASLISTMGHEFYHAKLFSAGVVPSIYSHRHVSSRHHAAINVWQRHADRQLGISRKTIYLGGYNPSDHLRPEDLLLMPKFK